MPEEQRNYNDQRNCGCNGNNGGCGGFLGNLFGGGCCNNGNSEVLFFIIIFLLLFTNFGCCNN